LIFLLDTNVVSELRRSRPHGAVLEWLALIREEELFISAATIGEIQAGIEKAREHHPEKSDEIERWLVEAVLGMNVITVDAETFRIWARLMHKQQGHLWNDAMIAATALRHGATVVTRNVKDLQQFGVPVLNPFLTP
jgi:predicted nucleic acid-binding protein